MTFIQPDFKFIYPNEKQILKDDSVIEDFLAEFEIVVILGAPGSGKTYLLKSTTKSNEFQNSDYLFQYLTVKDFIRATNSKINENATIYLIDGLDEYRSTQGDEKVYVIDDLVDRINAQSDKRFVLSCREMDWFGDADIKALKDNEFKKSVCVVQILPFNERKQFQLIKNEIKDDDKAWELFNRLRPFGLMSNPQLLSMILEVNKSDPNFQFESKSDLYNRFVTFISEKNQIHQLISKVKLNNVERVKLLGYLGFYYFFSNREIFDKSFIIEIKWEEKGFTYEKLMKLLGSMLFNEGKILHRTIFEYSLSNFIYSELLRTKKWTHKRVKSLFTKNNHVYSELRGVYSWICSLTKDTELIKIDPYNQLLNGDNNAFDIDLKIQVLLEIEAYAKYTNPYFYRYDHNYQFIGFYQSELDDLIISKIYDSKHDTNHFGVFLSAIISATKEPSEHLRDEVKELIKEPTIPIGFKTRLVKVFEPNNPFLIEILDSIIGGEIEDSENDLMNVVLKLTYPEFVTTTTIKKYLVHFKSNVRGYANFLLKTPSENEMELVEFLYKECKIEKGHENYRNFPASLERFIENYFIKLVLTYPVEKTSKEIFNTLIHFWDNYHEHWETLNFNGYRHLTEKKKKEKKKDMRELAKELFRLFVNDSIVKGKEFYDLDDFSHLFNIELPAERFEIIVNILENEIDSENRLKLYQAALRYRSDNDKDLLQNIAEKYGFMNEFNLCYNREPFDWEIKREQEEQVRLQTIEIEKDANEEYFANKTDVELRNNFSIMNWFANHFNEGGLIDSSNVNIEEKTYERLKNILSEYHKSKQNHHLCNLITLSKDSPTANRNIDSVVYTSLSFNNWEHKTTLIDELHKYLYVLSALDEQVGNIIDNGFLNAFEIQHSDETLIILREYLTLLIDFHVPDIKGVIMSHVESELDKSKIKQCIRLIKNENDSIADVLIHNLLTVFGLQLSESELKQIEFLITQEKSNKLIKVLIKLFDDNPFTKSEFYDVLELLGRYAEDYSEFKDLESKKKVHILNKMMNLFDSKDSINTNNEHFKVSSFLRQVSLNNLSIEELKELLEFRKSQNPNMDLDFWQSEIKQVLHDKIGKEITFQNEFLSIEEVKKLIQENEISTYCDFFNYIVEEIDEVINTIEVNDDNEVNLFFNTETPKHENDCRDIIVKDLKNRNLSKIEIIREFNRANTRVDMKIQSKLNSNWVVYLEAKRNSNSELKSGLNNQLIGLYLNEKVPYGIYLLFNFGKKNKFKLINEIQLTLPSEKIDEIKVLCLDLKLPKKASKK